MSDRKRWEDRYKAGAIPWDVGRPDFNLIDMVMQRPIPSCQALEIGCGTGSNAVWLAEHNFKVTATDVSEAAIQIARRKAADAGVTCTFFVMDFLNANVSGAPFGFAFDRGCFHSFGSDEERNRFAENVAFHLEERGLWLSLVGSIDDGPRDVGPPQRSARDIVTAVEPHFQILSLTSSHFDSNRWEPPRIWVCLAQKRNNTK